MHSPRMVTRDSQNMHTEISGLKWVLHAVHVQGVNGRPFRCLVDITQFLLFRPSEVKFQMIEHATYFLLVVASHPYMYPQL